MDLLGRYRRGVGVMLLVRAFGMLLLYFGHFFVGERLVEGSRRASDR